MKVPDGLRFTAAHEWVTEPAGGTVRVGITDFAQDSLGDIVYIQLPEVGTQVTAGDVLGEVESTKSVSEIYSPLAGEVTAVNEAASDSPELINSDPYGDGWLVEIRVADPTAFNDLLDADGYQQLTT